MKPTATMLFESALDELISAADADDTERFDSIMTTLRENAFFDKDAPIGWEKTMVSWLSDPTPVDGSLEKARLIVEAAGRMCARVDKAFITTLNEQKRLFESAMSKHGVKLSETLRKKKTTAEQLVEMWLNQSSNPAEIVALEERLARELSSASAAPSEPAQIDPLVIKLMTERLNKKCDVMIPAQRKLITLASKPGTDDELIEHTRRIRESLLKSIDRTLATKADGEFGDLVLERLSEARAVVDSLNGEYESYDDLIDDLPKYMVLSSLDHELSTKGD